MKLTKNRLYGYKVYYTKKKTHYTNSYDAAYFQKRLLELKTKHRWKVKPVSRLECKKAWKNCPFNKLLGENYETKFTSK